MGLVRVEKHTFGTNSASQDEGHCRALTRFDSCFFTGENDPGDIVACLSHGIQTESRAISRDCAIVNAFQLAK